jgi:hypothetical protein
LKQQVFLYTVLFKQTPGDIAMALGSSHILTGLGLLAGLLFGSGETGGGLTLAIAASVVVCMGRNGMLRHD